MFFSNLVMYFIILATAATLYKSGKSDIQSATDAAMALEPPAFCAGLDPVFRKKRALKPAAT
jgi:hypothetical protein